MDGPPLGPTGSTPSPPREATFCVQLENGSGWELYDAGCLVWNYQQHAWYTRCGLPQNAPIAPPPPVVAKD